MARFDMLPLWTDALVADTASMSHQRFGQYMRLLVAWWRDGCQAASLEHLEDISGVELADLQRLTRFLTETPDGYIQKKLFEVWANQVEKSGKARDAARERWEREKNASADNSDANAPPEPCERTAGAYASRSRSRSSLSKDKQKGARKRANDFGKGKGACLEPALPDEPEAAAMARRLIGRIGAANYVAWFMNADGASIIAKNCEGYVLSPDSNFKRDMIEQQHSPALTEVFGKGCWRVAKASKLKQELAG